MRGAEQNINRANRQNEKGIELYKQGDMTQGNVKVREADEWAAQRKVGRQLPQAGIVGMERIESWKPGQAPLPKQPDLSTMLCPQRKRKKNIHLSEDEE